MVSDAASASAKRSVGQNTIQQPAQNREYKIANGNHKKMLRRRHACDVTYARDRYIQVDNFGIDERISLSSSHCHISNKNQPYRKDIAYGRIPLFSLLFQNN